MRNLFKMICFSVYMLGMSACTQSIPDKVKETLREEVLIRAEKAMIQEPVTITAFIAERSAGDIHDFYSEGDYWWLDPENPEGPYIRRDGETNPDNFVEHRHALIRMSQIVGDLTSAYVLTGSERYAARALEHMYAWFVNPQTRMNPDLQYAQAIKGVVTGRGIGIIDTIHLIEVARSLEILRKRSQGVDKNIIDWFEQYTNWLFEHPYGVKEMEAKNNHGTCWVMQVAAFSRLTGDVKKLDFCERRYKKELLPRQMAADGSFPLELERTKPYGYSLFNLDAMATLAYLLTTENRELWKYQTEQGLSIQTGIDFLTPYVEQKENWPFQQDIMFWEEWPVAHPFLLFAALLENDEQKFDLWYSLEHFPQNEEVIRNLPIRNPILWLEM